VFLHSGISLQIYRLKGTSQVPISRWVKMDQEQDVFVWPCFGDVVAFGTGGIRHRKSARAVNGAYRDTW
jgi:hypothetical protein